MKTTMKLAGVLMPLVLVIAVLHFVQQAMQPLVLPLLFIMAVCVAGWLYRHLRPPGRGD